MSTPIKNNRIKTIDNSGIEEKHLNNGKTQTILLEYGNSLYQIKIHVESYDFQSYAKLYVMNSSKSWVVLKNIQPKDFEITSFYEPYSKDKFKPIIDKFKELIKKLSKVIDKE